MSVNKWLYSLQAQNVLPYTASVFFTLLSLLVMWRFLSLSRRITNLDCSPLLSQSGSCLTTHANVTTHYHTDLQLYVERLFLSTIDRQLRIVASTTAAPNYSFLFFFLQLQCPNGISTMGNSGCLPRGKPAETKSRYSTQSACWVIQCFHNPPNSVMDYGSLVSWCFEPSQPQRITSGLKTNFSLSPSY